jgi:hypothetical protein
MASSSPKLSRFDLPGFSLPLNFSPHSAYKKRSYDVASSAMKEIEVPACGEEQDLFPSALVPGVTNSQYELLSRDYQSLTLIRLSLTTLREFTMIQMMNYITDKPDWETKVQPAQSLPIFIRQKRTCSEPC